MRTYIFNSQFRSGSFEDIPGVSISNYQVVTTSEEVAAKLRMKRGLFEVPQPEEIQASIDALATKPAPAPEAPSGEEAQASPKEPTIEERIEARRPKTVRGAKNSLSREGKQP